MHLVRILSLGVVVSVMIYVVMAARSGTGPTILGTLRVVSITIATAASIYAVMTAAGKRARK